MNPEKLLTILRSPVISEKSTRLGEKHKQFTFKVLLTATKSEIKEAVEQLFKVTVAAVSVVVVKGKTKRFKQMAGRRSDWKKAYVTLADNQDIQFSSVE